MSASPDDLKRLREYAEAIDREVQEAVAAHGIAAIHQDLVQRLRSAAADTIREASTPVRIGLVGEFSAGKTLLLGALVGHVGVLPISPNPTTGNITVLEFIQNPEPGIQPTKIVSCKVEYLSRDEVYACLEQMLHEAVERARAAQLGDELRNKLNQVLATVKARAPSSLENVESWCRDAWPTTVNPRLRFLIRELVELVRCSIVFGATLCGTSHVVNEDTLRDGLMLEVPDANGITVTPFAKLLTDSAKLPTVTTPLTTTLVQHTFSLIRQCRIQVQLSRAIWDLSAMRDTNPFVLIDFPGLGADSSGVRDYYLCLRELANVHTILVLVDGARPGAGGILEVVNMMQRDHANLSDKFLVAISRFDMLPFSETDKHTWLRLASVVKKTTPASSQVIDWSSADDFEMQPAENEGVDENMMLQALPTLRSVVGSARAFVTNKDSRIVPISAVLGLAALTTHFPVLPIVAPRFRAELDNLVPPAQISSDTWAALCQRLPPNGALHQWLSAYGNDGGLTALRSLLQRHVQDHGLDLILQRAVPTVGILNDLREQVIRTLCQEGGQGDTYHQTLGAILQLRNKYTQWKLDLEHMLHPLLQIETSGGDVSSVALSDKVQEEVVARVFDWHEWTNLHNQVETGYIQPVPPGENEWDDSLDMSNGVPTCGNDFFPLFQTMYLQVDQFVQTHVEQAITRWLNKKTGEILPLSIQLNLNQATQQRIQSVLQDEMEVKRFKVLSATTRPDWLKDQVIRVLNAKLKERGGLGLDASEQQRIHDIELRCQRIFPLNPQRPFAWNPVVAMLPAEQRHSVQILRLRNEIINSASRELSELASQIDHSLVQILRDMCTQRSKTLAHIATKSDFVSVLSGAVPGPQHHGLVDKLNQLVNPLEPKPIVAG